MNKYLSMFFLFQLIAATCFSQQEKSWTIMHYSAGSNSSEIDLLADIEEMKQGKNSKEYHLITLIDRVEGHSEDAKTLGENFTDTRMYEIQHNEFIRLDGREFFPEMQKNSIYEANMGNAQVLRDFIRYCKKYYPAKNYMLILRSHGNGVAMCPDAESGINDRLYPGEISDVLTQEESVSILGLDVCSMAGLENLYEWRPSTKAFSADYVIASAPLSAAWAYDELLIRLEKNADDPTSLDPETMSPMEFSSLIIEEVEKSQRWASWGLFDNSKIKDVKQNIDQIVPFLLEENRDSVYMIIEKTLGYYHNTSDNLEIAQLTFPYLDAFHFWSQIAENASFSTNTKNAAKEICRSLDELVITSYYGRGYLPETNNFKENISGIYQIIPLGRKIFSQTNRSYWSHCGWFSPRDLSGQTDAYGKYDWCSEGAIQGNQKVETFYEFLDVLFDKNNDISGGVNQYQW